LTADNAARRRENAIAMKKTIFLFGLLSAAVAIVMMLATVPLLDAWGHQKTDLLGYGAMVLSALLVFFGIRYYRERAGEGGLGFGRAFAVGLLITLVSSVCQVAAFQLVYFRLVPEFGDRFAACMVERAEDAGATPEKIVETARQAEALKRLYDNPWTNAALTFAQPLPLGIVAAGLSAAVLRRRSGRREQS
jgi:hypothetical protein